MPARPRPPARRRALVRAVTAADRGGRARTTSSGRGRGTRTSVSRAARSLSPLSSSGTRSTRIPFGAVKAVASGALLHRSRSVIERAAATAASSAARRSASGPTAESVATRGRSAGKISSTRSSGAPAGSLSAHSHSSVSSNALTAHGTTISAPRTAAPAEHGGRKRRSAPSFATSGKTAVRHRRILLECSTPRRNSVAHACRQ